MTDKGIIIAIENVSVTPKYGSDEFGLLEGAQLVILGILRKASFSESDNANGRFEWPLMGRDELSDEEHTFVFLDCPQRDVPGILSPDADVYVVPGAQGERTSSEESKYLTCSILQLGKTCKEGPAFKRVGVTKLSSYGDHKALEDLEILKAYESDGAMPHKGYNSKPGKNRYNPATGMPRIPLI